MKKLTKCLIAILLLLSITVPTVVFAAEDDLTYYGEIITGKGDVNGDGIADNLDASLILKYDAGLIDSVEGGDINGDGKVDNLDAMFVLKYDAGIPNINIQVPNSVDFKWSYVSTCCAAENEFNGEYILNSTEELTALYNEHFGALSEYNHDFNEAIAGYDEAFFAEKSLIIIGIGGHSSSVSYTVAGLEVQCEGNSEVSEVVALKATISVLYPMMKNADVATGNIIIEFDKEYTVDQSGLYVSYDVTSIEYLSKGSDWDYEYTYIPTQYSEGVNSLSDRVITSTEELTAFYEEYKELCKFDTAHGYNAISFKDAIAGYDKAFFDRRYLIMLPISGHSSSETFSVDEIQALRSGYSFEGELKALNIKIAVNSPLLQTTDLVAGHIIIEINKTYEVDESKLVVKTKYIRDEDSVSYTEYNNAGLIVKGTPLVTTPSATTHPFAPQAALPLTAILKELGASVVDGENGLKTVTYGDKVYDLKMENYILFPSMEDRETGNDLLQVDGEPYFVYVSEGELMVEDCVLSNVFWFMGIECAIYIDEYNRIINIV